jgi:hypothetical protein
MNPFILESIFPCPYIGHIPKNTSKNFSKTA